MNEIIDKFKDMRIGIIGDIMLDEYWFGDADRLSPEAPVPIVRYLDKKYSRGGAANVYGNVIALGARADLLGVVGSDRPGEIIKGMCDYRKNHGIVISINRPTTLKLRIVVNDHQLIRIDTESTEYIDGPLIGHLVETMSKFIKKWDALIISDYNKGVISPPIAAWITNNVRIPVIADPKGKWGNFYTKCTVITPNEKELYHLTEWDQSANIEGIVKAARELIEVHDIGNVLVTRGKKGMTLVWKSSEDGISSIVINAVNPDRVIDVTGAGDTVIAVLTLAIAAGASVQKAARLANKAAGIVVGKFGTSTVGIEELKGVL